jgi:3-oxoacyl-[acyl-carrier protein] reductase
MVICDCDVEPVGQSQIPNPIPNHKSQIANRKYDLLMPELSPALTGQVVLVTGGSSGIGQAIALACARNGADVAITYRSNQPGADETAAAITAQGRRTAVRRLDLANEEDIRALAPWMHETFGRVDTWVNNAGADILTGSAAALPTVQKLDMLLAVDLRGTILASWEAVALMKAQQQGGSIINMSWDHVSHGMEGTNPQMYAAVKGGIMAFSKGLARSVAPAIRVNIIAPGWIETAFGEGIDDEVYRKVAQSAPMKRWGRPDDVAGAAVYLASPAAAFLTGQTIMVGGGVVM